MPWCGDIRYNLKYWWLTLEEVIELFCPPKLFQLFILLRVHDDNCLIVHTAPWHTTNLSSVYQHDGGAENIFVKNKIFTDNVENDIILSEPEKLKFSFHIYSTCVIVNRRWMMTQCQRWYETRDSLIVLDYFKESVGN